MMNLKPDRNYQAESFSDLEKKIILYSNKDVGKTDICFLGLLQDKYTLSNLTLLGETLDSFINVKERVFKYKEGRHTIIDFMYELFRLVKVKKQHIIVAFQNIEEQLVLAKKCDILPFQHIQKQYKDESKSLHNKVLSLIKCNVDAPSQPGTSLHFDLFLQSYWMSNKLQDSNIRNFNEKLAKNLNILSESGRSPTLAYLKYQAIQNLDLVYQNEQSSQNASLQKNQGVLIKKDVPIRYPIKPEINNPINLNKENERRLDNPPEKIYQSLPTQLEKTKIPSDDLKFPFNPLQDQLFPNITQPVPPTISAPVIIPIDEEAKEILKKVNDISATEITVFLKFYGKFKYLMQPSQSLDAGYVNDIKKKYKEIYCLSKACKSLQKVRQVTPRPVQVISCLLFLFKQKGKGRILQINTGEGKSITVALLAATQSLLNNKVDVYTSNKELAKRDCEEFLEFYQHLGLTAGSIGSEEQRSSEPNPTYEFNIVYGDVGSYAADLLGDQYEMRGTRCGRPFDYAIVDEVDCMFIDQHNHSTSLAKSIPGLSKLNMILWLIWYKISQMKDHFLNGTFFFSGETKALCHGEKYIQEYIKQLIEKGEIAEEINKQIPSHTRAFALTQMSEWIRNGFYALELQRNKEYKIDDDKIIPIDYDNTGLAQNNTQWRGGLHQFVQMKENVTVTPMTMTVNFVSNIYMFLLYKSNLIGLTGTLGTAKSVNILESFYTVDSLKIPPFKQRKLKILDPIVNSTTSQFAIALFNEIQEKKDEGRPCLIICESEKFGKKLFKALCNKFPDARVIEYYSGDDSIEKESLNGFCVIISTNLAGRGTDIKLDTAIVEKGGLHVIVAFTPKNKRVEDQAFGRAGRQGQEGSARMLIDGATDTFIVKNKISGDLIEERDKVDNKICDRQLQNMKDISKMDEVFWDYCKMLNSCKALKDKQYLRKQEEEIWATFYCKIQALRNDSEKVKQEYSIFKEEFSKRIEEKKIVNPSYLINEGMNLLQSDRFSDALHISEQIIAKHPLYIPANYIKAISLVMLNKYTKALQALAICEEQLCVKDDMNQALQIIQLQSQQLIQQEHNEELFKQSFIVDRVLTESIFVFGTHSKYKREEIEQMITQNGCYKRIKDQEVIRGKVYSQIKELKDDINILERNAYLKPKLSFVHVNDYFKDDKITGQVLKEYQSEETSFIVELKNSKPIKWKSLIPLTCGVFQLTNSLYLLQTQSEETQFLGQTEAHCQELVEQQDKGIQVISESINRISQMRAEDLKKYLSKRALHLIECVREFKLANNSPILTLMSDETADQAQRDMMKNINAKNYLVKEIVKRSPNMDGIAKSMMQDAKLEQISQVNSNYQENCHKVLEKQSIETTFAKEISQIDLLEASFRREFPCFAFSSFATEIIDGVIRGMATDKMKDMTSQMEEFINQNYTKVLNSAQFVEVIVGIIGQPFADSLKKVSGELKRPIANVAKDQVLTNLKDSIKQLKNSLKQGIPNSQTGGYIQQKQMQYYDQKLRIQQKFYSYLKEDKEIMQSIPIIIMKVLKSMNCIDSTGRVSLSFNSMQLKNEVKNQIIKENTKIQEFIEQIELLINPYITFVEKKSTNPISSQSSKEFAPHIIKRISDKLITPIFKSAQHVFHNQIESIAINGLFQQIIS